MSASPLERHSELRARAVALLGNGDLGSARSTTALTVMYELASNPATADKALGLLHELQVHQVELDLQNEELRRAQMELEAAYARQLQLYHGAPIAYATVRRDTSIREVNRRMEQVFALPREQLLGRMLDSFLLPPSRAMLGQLLALLASGSGTPAQVELHLNSPTGGPQLLRVDAVRETDGEHFLLAIALAKRQV